MIKHLPLAQVMISRSWDQALNQGGTLLLLLSSASLPACALSLSLLLAHSQINKIFNNNDNNFWSVTEAEQKSLVLHAAEKEPLRDTIQIIGFTEKFWRAWECGFKTWLDQPNHIDVHIHTHT